MSAPLARAAWLNHLAALLGGSVAGDEVAFDLGVAQVAITMRVASGPGGRPIVTPAVNVSVTADASARARVTADLLRLDLATGAVRALPQLAAFVHVGRRPDGGTPLLVGDPQVDAVRIGFTLDESRRPAFLLAADGVTIAGHAYPTLDLSHPRGDCQCRRNHTERRRRRIDFAAWRARQCGEKDHRPRGASGRSRRHAREPRGVLARSAGRRCRILARPRARSPHGSCGTPR